MSLNVRRWGARRCKKQLDYQILSKVAAAMCQRCKVNPTIQLFFACTVSMAVAARVADGGVPGAGYVLQH